MWAQIEVGVCLLIAGLFFVVGSVEMFSYVFLNMANPLFIMPRISENLGHYYHGRDAKEKKQSKVLFLKNSFFYGLAFLAFLTPLFCAYGLVDFVNANEIASNQEMFKKIQIRSGVLIGCTTGLFFLLDFLYILFMETHPKQKTIFEVVFNFRKVSGRQ